MLNSSSKPPRIEAEGTIENPRTNRSYEKLHREEGATDGGKHHLNPNECSREDYP
jgi:hypothetical protein